MGERMTEDLLQTLVDEERLDAFARHFARFVVRHGVTTTPVCCHSVRRW